MNVWRSAQLAVENAGIAVILGLIRQLRTAVVMPVATERGGAEATLLQLLQHAPAGTDWHVIFLEPGPMVEKVRGFGADATVVPAGRVRQLWEAARAVRRIGSVLRSWRADSVVSWMSKGHLYAAPAAAALDLPALWFQQGMPSSTDPIDRLVTLLPTGAVLTPSRTVATAQHALWPHPATRVAYPGIDLDELAGSDVSQARRQVEEFGIPPVAPVVGLVGRLQRWKGIDVLVSALPGVIQAHPEAHLVVVGGDHALEPGYGDSLVALAEELGIADRVHLVGYQRDARSWMAAFDVAVHASDVEPFGLVVLEAMALGKPLIAGAKGGPAEIIRDGVEGFLVPYGDSAGLSRRIVDYLDDPELGRRTGAAAISRAREFSPDRFATDVVHSLLLVKEAHRAR
jgi:glycosyltransferase involved in cell wall biosynthesis